jgi:hypothetical protein
MFIVVLFCAIIVPSCFGADYTDYTNVKSEADTNTIIDSALSAYLRNESMKEDPIAKQLKADSQLNAYMRVARKLIIFALENDPIIQKKNLTQQPYHVDAKISEGSSYDKLVNAKIQLLPTAADTTFFWQCEGQKNRNFYVNNKQHNPFDFLDCALSPDGKSVAMISNNGNLVCNAISQRGSSLDLNADVKIDAKNSDAIKTGAITWVADQKNKNASQIYCALNGKLYRFFVSSGIVVKKDDNFRPLQSQLVQGEYVRGISFFQDADENLLLCTMYRGNIFVGFKCIDCNTKTLILNDTVREVCMISYDAKIGYRDVLLESRKKLSDAEALTKNVETVGTQDIATARGLLNLNDYLSMDLNSTKNRVALLKAKKQPDISVYSPTVEYADFVPQHMRSTIKLYNETVEKLAQEWSTDTLSKLDDRNRRAVYSAREAKIKFLVQDAIRIQRSPSLFSRFKWWGLAAAGTAVAGIIGWFFYKSRGTIAPAPTTGQPVAHPSAVTRTLLPAK